MIKSISLVAGLLLAACAALILWRNLDSAVLAAALRDLAAFPASSILGAVCLVCVSFVLAGICEYGALRHLGVSLGLPRAMLVTVIANPIGHALSLPTLSGGALRYRIYAGWGLDRAQIARVVLLSAMPFLLGVTVLLSAAVLVASTQAAAALHLRRVVVVLAGIGGFAACAAYLICTTLPRFAGKLPRLRLSLLQLVCGIIEILSVGGALYLFLPQEPNLTLPGFVAVYLIGVVLGQISSVPAGLGVLEASLIVLLPQVPKGDLIAAAVAYRVVFDLIPLLTALGLLMLYEMGSRRGIIGRWWRASRAAD